jgi:gluconokinase/shikimate kinase
MQLTLAAPDAPVGAPDPVLVVMGVAGAGKSTVARTLAAALGWDFAEGDDLHPPENIAKMSSGVPLTDDDREPWLATVSSWIIEHAMAGSPGVITCSALKRRHRDVLRERNVVFVHVSGSGELIARRLAERGGHFMPASLLASQFAALESPAPDERVIRVDAALSPGEQVDSVLARLVRSGGSETARPETGNAPGTERQA